MNISIGLDGFFKTSYNSNGFLYGSMCGTSVLSKFLVRPAVAGAFWFFIVNEE